MENPAMLSAAVSVVGLALMAAACLLVGYLIYKVRQVHRTLYATDREVRKMAHYQSHNLSQRLQYLDLMRSELDLPRPLPPLVGWAAAPDILYKLARHVRRFRPLTIVECGSGSSTIVMAQAAKLNGEGHVYSVDHDGDFAEQTRDLLEQYGLADWATVLHAPLTPTEIDGSRWQWFDRDALPETPPIDLLFIDGPPGDTSQPLARYPAGPMLFPRLAPDGVVFLDDTLRPGETEILARWSSEFPHLGQHRHFCEKGCHELRPESRVLEESHLRTLGVNRPRRQMSFS